MGCGWHVRDRKGGAMSSAERVALVVGLALVFGILWGVGAWSVGGADAVACGVACGLFGVIVGGSLGVIIE